MALCSKLYLQKKGLLWNNREQFLVCPFSRSRLSPKNRYFPRSPQKDSILKKKGIHMMPPVDTEGETEVLLKQRTCVLFLGAGFVAFDRLSSVVHSLFGFISKANLGFTRLPERNTIQGDWFFFLICIWWCEFSTYTKSISLPQSKHTLLWNSLSLSDFISSRYSNVIARIYWIIQSTAWTEKKENFSSSSSSHFPAFFTLSLSRSLLFLCGRRGEVTLKGKK